MITITESAQEYLAELLTKQEDALGVRVFINQPGTPRAETCIAYCREGDVKSEDEERKFEKFTAWFDVCSGSGAPHHSNPPTTVAVDSG